MKKLPLPNYDFLSTYDICLQSSNSNNLIAMRAIRPNIADHEAIYQRRATNVTLHHSAMSRHGNSGDIVTGNVTKDDFVSLYEDCFVKTGTPGRAIYDALRTSSNGICPLCGIGGVSTLDHYLPKARYPLYSVFPVNLVPACMDCNKGKGSSVLTSSDEEPLHPYFVAQHFIDEHWIRAEIVESKPLSARFFPEPPVNWDQDSRQRAINHFNDFQLDNKYRTQASLFFTMFTSMVKDLIHRQRLSTVEIQEHFLSMSVNELPNSVSRSVMAAISESDWFCTEQYLE